MPAAGASTEPGVGLGAAATAAAVGGALAFAGASTGWESPSSEDPDERLLIPEAGGGIGGRMPRGGGVGCARGVRGRRCGLCQGLAMAGEKLLAVVDWRETGLEWRAVQVRAAQWCTVQEGG